MNIFVSPGNTASMTTAEEFVHADDGTLRHLNQTIFMTSFSSLWSIDVIKHQTSWWTLVQIMAYHLLDAKPLPEPMLTYWLLDPCEQTSVNLKQNITISIQWNEFENVVYKMPNIWSQPSCVNFVNCGETKIDCSDGLQELNCDYLWGHMHGSCWWWTILCLYMVGPHDFLRRLVRCICGLIAVW